MLVLADGGRFTDEQRRLRYCFSLLKGDAYTTMEPYVSTAGVALADVAAFLAEITKIFGDSDEKSTAARELEKLKQGNRDFPVYYADFARLTAILDLTEESKKQALERGISTEIRNAMVNQDDPENETLEHYAGPLKRMDERLRRLPGRGSKPTPAPVHNPRPAPTTATGAHPGPMDLSASKNRRLTPEERGRRIAQGLCLYCGGHGHMARDCPNRPAAQGRVQPPGQGQNNRPLRVAASEVEPPAAESPPGSTPSPAPPVTPGVWRGNAHTPIHFGTGASPLTLDALAARFPSNANSRSPSRWSVPRWLVGLMTFPALVR